MSCLIKTTGNIKTLSLLTKEEKLTYIRQLFLYKNSGKQNGIFTPSIDFYTDNKVDDDQLSYMADQLLRWLGVKHHSLRVNFSNGTETRPIYLHENKKHKIIIPYLASNNSFYCGALLAHAVMHYFLTSRGRIALVDSQNEEFTDIACISAGFGIVLLNGYVPYRSRLQRVFGRHSNLSMPGMTPEQIAEETINYISSNRIANNMWLGVALPGARLALAQPPTGKPYLPYVRKVQDNIHKARLKTLLLIVLVATLMGIITFLIARNQDKQVYLPAEMVDQKEAIEVLRGQYEICQASLAAQKETGHQDDIYKIRVDEARQNQCKSIRNLLVNEVQSYNKKLEQL